MEKLSQLQRLDLGFGDRELTRYFWDYCLSREGLSACKRHFAQKKMKVEVTMDERRTPHAILAATVAAPAAAAADPAAAADQVAADPASTTEPSADPPCCRSDFKALQRAPTSGRVTGRFYQYEDRSHRLLAGVWTGVRWHCALAPTKRHTRACTACTVASE